ncbi:MAG: ABC transporter substrate-binding protein [Saprospiraceae bacterium]|nr:ABC transporter substrate-binding protein [Saprospiraceae bacterium]
MEKLKLALDWTPNINHIGFFVAKEKGFYEELGLEVFIADPSLDNYGVTPAKKVELGLVDFALCPTESIISYRTKDTPFDLIAIAAILQEDLSAIVVKGDSGINSPKDLDHKTYSSYRARYEDGIVKEMIRNDGGKGELNIVYPDKLGIWNTLLKGEADATWIFLNWEGVQVEYSLHQLQYFKMRDYNIPYSYSPVIAASESKVAEKRTQYSAFVQATKKGFLYCQESPATAAKLLAQYIPPHDKGINLERALERSAPHFGTKDTWGRLEQSAVEAFLHWITEKKLEPNPLDFSQICTTACLD